VQDHAFVDARDVMAIFGHGLARILVVLLPDSLGLDAEEMAPITSKGTLTRAASAESASRVS
jgi:hypothetical protein